MKSRMAARCSIKVANDSCSCQPMATMRPAASTIAPSGASRRTERALRGGPSAPLAGSLPSDAMRVTNLTRMAGLARAFHRLLSDLRDLTSCTAGSYCDGYTPRVFSRRGDTLLTRDKLRSHNALEGSHETSAPQAILASGRRCRGAADRVADCVRASLSDAAGAD